MKIDTYRPVRDFEAALCEYTGAPYAVTTNSCTMALLLAVAWHLRRDAPMTATMALALQHRGGPHIDIPKRTYVGVPMSIIHAGGRPTFRDQPWAGSYDLRPFPIWDSARDFTGGMYRGKCAIGKMPNGERAYGEIDRAGQMICVSFHWSKTLGIEQGGAILHDNPEADAWLRRARFDGRTEGVAPKDDTFPMLGWHAYMSPETATRGLMRLANLPLHNDPLPNDVYPDLSTMEIFRQ